MWIRNSLWVSSSLPLSQLNQPGQDKQYLLCSSASRTMRCEVSITPGWAGTLCTLCTLAFGVLLEDLHRNLGGFQG